MSTLLGDIGLLNEFTLGGLSVNGLLLSPNGELLSLTGVPQRGVEFPLRLPKESIDALFL